jgi:serine/threonine protein phosphatase 1
MSYTVVVPDLHGRQDLLGLLLTAIEGAELGNHKLVFLGDYIDRGPQSAEVIAAVRGLESAVCLKGNHESFMEHCILDQLDPEMWMINGGGTSLLSYNNLYGEEAETKLVEDALWIRSLPLYYEDQHRVYVHAAAPYYDDIPLAEASVATLLWQRYPDDYSSPYRGKHIVHGHTPKEKGPLIKLHTTNLDVGAVWTGRLVAGVFDDDVPGGPVSVIEVRA